MTPSVVNSFFSSFFKSRNLLPAMSIVVLEYTNRSLRTWSDSLKAITALQTSSTSKESLENRYVALKSTFTGLSREDGPFASCAHDEVVFIFDRAFKIDLLPAAVSIDFALIRMAL